jgi:translation initiation factor 3 subunit G
MVSTMRWGDTLEDDDFDELTAQALVAAKPTKELKLPPKQVFGPDKDGVKTIVEYKAENGQKIKITKKVRVSKKEMRTSKGVLERRNLTKFGEAVGLNAEQERTTMSMTEDILLERVKTSKDNTKKEDNFDQLQALATTKALLRMSGIAGKTDGPAAAFGATKAYKVPMSARRGGGEMPPGEGDGPSGPRPGSGQYVPPNLRAGASSVGDTMRQRRDENSVRVTNLSEDTKEADLVDLFSPFGSISRIYIAYDRETRESRGFAFINFVRRDEGQRAIDKLDGFGYDNLILRVEWAAPREPRPEGQGR